jgi:hypothetical protein
VITLRALVLLLVLGTPGAARALVLGGGLADKDCRLAFGGVDATDGASQATCGDGAACDADGAADGSCRFVIALCAGVPEVGCAPDPLTALDVHGLPLAAPPLPSTADTCGPAAAVTVPVLGQVGVTAVARDGRALKDVDYLNLCCVSTPSPLASARCALGVMPEIAGCPGDTLPARARAGFEQARALLADLAADPGRVEARRLAAKAARKLRRVRRLAKRLAKRQTCGNTLGLVVTHALERVRVLTAPLPRQAPSR